MRKAFHKTQPLRLSAKLRDRGRLEPENLISIDILLRFFVSDFHRVLSVKMRKREMGSKLILACKADFRR